MRNGMINAGILCSGSCLPRDLVMLLDIISVSGPAIGYAIMIPAKDPKVNRPIPLGFRRYGGGESS